MNKKVLVLISLTLTSGCGITPTLPIPTPPDVPVAPAIPPIMLPSPIPSPSASPMPACKALQGVWNTPNQTTAPESQLMGIYTGIPSNGPIYTLDLTQLQPGANALAPFAYDATHVCYYNVQLNTSDYVINSFQGCNITTLGSHTQCDYCPYSVGDPQHVNVLYSFNLSCNSLTITDSSTNKTESYQ